MNRTVVTWKGRQARRRKTTPRVEALEDRLAPAALPLPSVIREATGPDAAAIQATRDTFRTDLGGGTTAGANGSFGGVRREINWDGVPDAFSSPNNLPPDFFNINSPRGAVFGFSNGTGTGFQVSANAVNPTNTPVRFGNLNPNYPDDFSVFSPQKLFTPLGANVFDVTFFVAGTTTPAVTNGFGAVFTDVDTAGATRLEFFDALGRRIFQRDVLATAGNASQSFLGVAYDEAVIARVRFTNGTAVVGADDAPPGADVVVQDDFLYGEPVDASTVPPPAPSVALFAVGAGAGGGPHVKAFNADGSERFSFFAYASTFPGGVTVATGDVNGDFVDDIITGAGPGGGPHVKVFDGETGAEIRSFFAYGADFLGGVFVGAGDLDGDGCADVITGAGPGGGPHVKAFNSATGAEALSFFAYAASFGGGVAVAAGDVNDDGQIDVVTGAGPGGGPHVKAFDGQSLAELGSFFAYDAAFVGGVFVAAGNGEGVGPDDVLVGPGEGRPPAVRAFDAVTGQQLGNEQIVFDPAFLGGVRVGSADLDGDGSDEAVLGAGPGIGPRVVLADPQTLAILDDFFAFDPTFQGGVFVG